MRQLPITLLAIFFLLAVVAPPARGRQQSPGDPRADSLERAGAALYADGRYEEAVALLAQLDTSCCSARALYALGSSYASLNDVQPALRFLRLAAGADSLNTSYRFHFARALAQCGAAGEAEQEYRHILRQDTTHIAAAMQLGQACYERRLYDTALAYFCRVLEKNPRDYMACYLAGSSLVGLKQYDSARTHLAAAMTVNPHYTPAIILLASICLSAGNHREARQLYDLAAQQRPYDAELSFKSGLCSEKLDEIEKAQAAYRRALALDSANDRYYAQLGNTYFQQSNFDSAAFAFDRAAALDPDNSSYLINLGYARQKMNAIDAAGEAYQRAIAAQHPENIAAVDVRLGTLYYLQKQYKRALAAYTHALANSPQNKEAQFYLALTQDRLANTQSALVQYQKYLKLASGDTARLERERRAQARHRLSYLRKR